MKLLLDFTVFKLPIFSTKCISTLQKQGIFAQRAIWLWQIQSFVSTYLLQIDMPTQSIAHVNTFFSLLLSILFRRAVFRTPDILLNPSPDDASVGIREKHTNKTGRLWTNLSWKSKQGKLSIWYSRPYMKYLFPFFPSTPCDSLFLLSFTHMVKMCFHWFLWNKFPIISLSAALMGNIADNHDIFKVCLSLNEVTWHKFD